MSPNLGYKKKHSAHGFLLERSVVTNAQQHAKKSYVFNIDIQDYFPSINFGRVRGMFMAKPYNLPAEVATTLAKMCCFRNVLPQGAPTSPMISNMLCGKLDSNLQKISRDYNCNYTRYADDITISTNQKEFPPEIAYLDLPTNQVHIGKELSEIISSNGFVINSSKIRLQHKDKRQEVTGLIVNSFPNVKRRFIRQIRSMLNAWKKYGYNNAEQEYYERYNFKQRNPDNELPKFINIVRGKIEYVKMVKGESDIVFKKLAIMYNELADTGLFPQYFIDPTEELKASVWVIECGHIQGTGFMLEGVGLVTCQHVICTECKEMVAFRCNEPSIQYPVKIIIQDKYLDLAILQIDCKNIHYLKMENSSTVTRESDIKLVGFPQYGGSSSDIYIENGKMTSKKEDCGRPRILISQRIVVGNSGGPIVNQDNSVIGVAVKGINEYEDDRDTTYFGVIPIELIDILIKRTVA